MTDQLDRLKTALADRYAIEREIGSGGMATVYLAEDLKHHRQVAIKVLRPDLAATLGPERFLREIEVAARLQHPHILPLHDSGEADGFLYYVMPFVEGQSLRDKLAKEGELPIGEAVRIIRDVVDALTEAHANGVVHRDIKPENILLRGRHALVTDFGVAKAVSEATGREQLTTAGVALGTPAYMAPEQAAADPHLDHRVDIYAVGAVAYELLTGRPVFMGTTPQMILSAHVTEAPQPVTKHRDTVPAVLDQLVLRCLEKKPADRFQSAEELLPQLEALATPSGGVTPMDTRPLAATPTKRRWLPYAMTAAAVLIVVGLAAREALTTDLIEITTSRNRQVTREPEIEFEPKISPVGNEIIYTAGLELDMHIYLTDLEGRGRPLALTSGLAGVHRYPIWHTEGSNVVFTSNEVRSTVDEIIATNIIPKLGGAARALSLPETDLVWDWTQHGNRVVCVRSDTIVVHSLDEGEETIVTTADDPHSVEWSPDGSKLVYVSRNSFFVRTGTLGNDAPSSVWVVDVAGGDPVQLTDTDSRNFSPVWMPDGLHILFISDREGTRDLYVRPLDRSGAPRGDPLQVANLDAHSISLSGDGRTLAYSKFFIRRNLWSLPLPENGPISVSSAIPFTTGNRFVSIEDVSRDGEWLTYDSDISGNHDIYWMRISGGDPVQLTTDSANDFHPAWSPDGREISFYSFRTGNRDVFVISVDGGNAVQLTDDPAEDHHPTWSPEGLRIAFFSDRTGRDEIWTVSRDTIGGSWDEPRQLTFEGGTQPHWSSDGQLLYVGQAAIKIIARDGRERVLLRFPTEGITEVETGRWSADGEMVYIKGIDGLGRHALWSMSADGGYPRPIVRFDSPTREPVEYFAVGGDRLYFALTEIDSDIWVMDLEW